MPLQEGVVLHYTAKARPGKEKELRDGLINLITASRHDSGNITYELHEVIGDPTTLILYEQWTSQEALDAHLETPLLLSFRAVADELIEGGFAIGMKKLRKLRPVSEQ
jgi:quinol monooxygenase YgiN